MLRTFTVTFSSGEEKEYEAISAARLFYHLSKFFMDFSIRMKGV